MTAAAAAPATPQPGPFTVFRNRGFVYLWTGQLVSTIGDALTSLAAGIIVYRETNSVLNVGIMLMVSAIPTLVFGLVAGVFVDRYDRKTIMIVTVVLQAALVAAIPFLITEGDSVFWLYVIVLLSSSVRQFFDPANDAVLPEVASEEELAAANSMMAIAQFGSTAVGFALAGLLAQFAVEVVFFIDAATFLFAGVLIALVKVPKLEVEESTSVGDVIRNLGVGARFIIETPVLRSMNLMRIPVMVIFGLQNVLLLPFALTVLDATEFEYGLQEGITSVGFVVGSLLMARYADRFRDGSWLIGSFLGMGLAGLAYALTRNVWLAIGLIGISGVLNAPSYVAGRLINQRNTPREMRGRVFSTSYVLRDIFYLAGMGLAGLADVIRVDLMFAVSSVVLVGVSLVGAFLPGIGQPAAEWRRSLALLRGAAAAPPVAGGRPATADDVQALGRYIPALAGMPQRDRDALIHTGRVVEAEAGSALTRAGDVGDSAYFVLEGRLVAGRTSGEGEYLSLSAMGPGDVIGEIAALTGSTRTADVVAEQPSTLLQVPSETLKQLMALPQFGPLVLGKMQERLARSTSIGDLPRFGRFDQQALRDLRAESAAEG
ncbi:MAG TPA: MFS transporter [Candidatus Limnocylindria bacterium]|nr:MFS transporter [Candidatus Limnocylindria bacterium]